MNKKRDYHKGYLYTGRDYVPTGKKPMSKSTVYLALSVCLIPILIVSVVLVFLIEFVDITSKTVISWVLFFFIFALIVKYLAYSWRYRDQKEVVKELPTCPLDYTNEFEEITENDSFFFDNDNNQ